MSHIRQAKAHSRHANRAGGFGGLDDTNKGSNGNPIDNFFSDLGITLPGEETKSTKNTATANSNSNSVASAPPSSAVNSLTVSSTSQTSSTATSTSTTTSASHTTSTTTHTSIPITTTVSGNALHQDITVTHVNSVTAEAAAVNSSAPAAPSTSNALVAPVIGGVAGGIVGLILLVFLITWFMVRSFRTSVFTEVDNILFFQRRRRPDQDAINFDPGAFRRSAMLMTDPPTHQDTVERGYNPANPPPMVERRPIYTQASFDNTVGVGSPTSGSQLVFQAPYSPITAGPNVTSPVSAYDHHSWGAPGTPGAPVPVLTRNTSGSSAHSVQSAGAPQYAAYPALPNQNRRNSNTTRNGQLAPPQNESEYLDLERTTSVTPFQAEQYVEISKQLNTEVPRGLDTPTVSQIVAEKMDLPPLPPQEDPFADGEEEQEQEVAELPMVQDMSFPAPPSPVLASSSRYGRERVESLPPTLPEIIVHSRVSVTSAYLSDAGSPDPAGQTVFMNAQLGKSQFAESPMGASRFPVTPSPLASSFTVPSPPAAATSFQTPAEPERAVQRPEAKKRQTVYSTVYDPEDAYGGI
ncbi:hypothetical protein B0H12DRAFT_589360 [Mycena haematopus]|nr:hypothetical protein B0H12DRAFT_589360 [Mycena haematopus]